jgi:hypothetical protein
MACESLVSRLTSLLPWFGTIALLAFLSSSSRARFLRSRVNSSKSASRRFCVKGWPGTGHSWVGFVAVSQLLLDLCAVGSSLRSYASRPFLSNFWGSVLISRTAGTFKPCLPLSGTFSIVIMAGTLIIHFSRFVPFSSTTCSFTWSMLGIAPEKLVSVNSFDSEGRC